MLRRLSTALLSTLFMSYAQAAPVTPPGVIQRGSVSPGNCTVWSSSGYVSDAGVPCPTSTSGLSVTAGGTGAQTLTNHGILVGQGTSAITSVSPLTSGQVVIGQGSSTDPLGKTIVGDCSLSSSGALTCTKTSGVTYAPSATIDTTNAGNISSGTLSISRIGTSGTPSSTTYLRGDNTWATVAESGGSPGGVTGDIQYNNAGVLGGVTSVPVANGGTAATTSQGALNNLISAPISTASYQVVPCTSSGGDESVFSTSMVSASTTGRGALLVPHGCSLANQWTVTSYGQANLFGFGATPNDPYTGRYARAMNFYVPGILASANGQTAININGTANFTMEGVNFFAQTTTSDDAYAPTSQINSFTNSGPGPGRGTIQLINSSFGGGNTVVGPPMDAYFNPVKAGGVKTVTLTSGGSGYTDGTYHTVPLVGGGGTGAFAQTVVVSGGAVTSVKLYGSGGYVAIPGRGYSAGDTLTMAAANLGGSGSGLALSVASTYTAGGSGNIFVKALNSNFAYGTGTSISGNLTDSRLVANTFTGAQAFQLVYGAGGNTFALNRFEDNTNAVDIGGPNGNGYPGLSIFVGNQFTTNSYGGGYDLRLGRGGGDVVVGNEIDSKYNTAAFGSSAATASMIIGGFGDYYGAVISGNNWATQPASTGKQYCIDIQAGYTTDYLNMSGNVCRGSTIVSPVNWGQVPAHFVADFVGETGYHAEMGRPFGIGTNTPLGTAQAVLDLVGTTSVRIPVGTTGQRPTGVDGMVRANTTTGLFEGYVNGSWNALGAGGSGPITPTSVHASAYISSTPQPLSVSAGAVSTDAALGNVFYVTLPDSTATTVTTPTNPTDGQILEYEFTQGSTGSGTASWGSGFDFGSAGAPILTTTAGKIDVVSFRYSARNAKWNYKGVAYAF